MAYVSLRIDPHTPEHVAPTVKTNAEEWPVLAQRLSGRTLIIPPHGRLREELLNLYVEMGATEVRVTDRAKVHQDHAVAVRGVVAQLAQAVGGGSTPARGRSAIPTRVGLNLLYGGTDAPAVHLDHETEPEWMARHRHPRVRRLLD